MQKEREREIEWKGDKNLGKRTIKKGVCEFAGLSWRSDGRPSVGKLDRLELELVATDDPRVVEILDPAIISFFSLSLFLCQTKKA